MHNVYIVDLLAKELELRYHHLKSPVAGLEKNVGIQK